jgi:acyl-homoserine-lactone acylase
MGAESSEKRALAALGVHRAIADRMKHQAAAARTPSMTHHRHRPAAIGPGVGLAALLLGSCGGSSAEAAEHVDIRLTEYGIAHIRAADYEGLGRGHGYAQARDNLCKIELGMLALDGRLSRHFGPDGMDSTLAIGAGTNLGSDLYFQGLNDRGVIERLVSQAAPLGPREEVRQLVRGYVKGFNQLLDEDSAFECSGADWLRPMTELDVYRRAYAVTTWLGQGRASAGIVSAEPPVMSSAVQSSLDLQAVFALSESAAATGGRPGSNAVALGAAATATGFGLEVANPHLRWDLDMRWWQTQLTVPGQLDVSGAGLIGMPLIVMGHTEKAAWSITMAEQTQHYTFFELHLVDGSPTTYWVDGEPEAMQRWDVGVPVRHPDGRIETVVKSQWWTRYGAVLGPDFFPWSAGSMNDDGRAYAFADPNAGNMRMLNTLFTLNHSQSVGDVLDAIVGTQGVPWWTVIAADADGETLFSQIQVVANVPDEHAEECVPAHWRDALQAERTFIFDGSRSACAWRTDADALEPGIFGPGTPDNPRIPVLLGSDYVANSNDSYWLPNANERIEHMPRILGDEGSQRSLRTRDTFTELTEQLDRAPFTRQAMQDLILSNRSRAAELSVDATLEMCRTLGADALSSSGGQAVDLRPACEVLGLWDRRMNADSRGALLFDRYWRRANELAAAGGGRLWSVPFDAEDPLGTPRGLDISGPFVSAALADATLELEAAGMALAAPLGDHQYVVRGGQRIPLGGGGGDDGLGVFNILNAPWDPALGYTGALDGSTYMHVVSFDGTACPDAVTLMTYSQSEEPTSLHHADQTQLYSRKQWVQDRFCEADILASPALEVIVLGPRGPRVAKAR